MAWSYSDSVRIDCEPVGRAGHALSHSLGGSHVRVLNTNLPDDPPRVVGVLFSHWPMAGAPERVFGFFRCRPMLFQADFYQRVPAGSCP